MIFIQLSENNRNGHYYGQNRQKKLRYCLSASFAMNYLIKEVKRL